MLNSILLYVPSRTKNIQDSHILEHTIGKKIEDSLNENGLVQDGIVLNAETFLDGFVITIYFASEKDEQKLVYLVNEAVKAPFYKVTQAELVRIQNELEEEEGENNEIISLYQPVSKVFGRDLKDLQTINKNFDLKKLKNEYRFQDYALSTFTSHGYHRVINARLTEMPFQYKNFQNENYISGTFVWTVNSIKEIINLYFIAFIFGQNSESLVTKYYLDPNDEYLGYCQPLIMFNSFCINYLVTAQKGQAIKEVESVFSLSNIKKLLDENFNFFKNSFKIYFQLTYTTNDLAIQLNKVLTGDIKNLNDEISSEIDRLNYSYLMKFICDVTSRRD